MKITENDNIQWERMGIYILLNENGKCYIGSTNNIKNRYFRHKHLLVNGKHGKYIQRAYNKKTAKFNFEILEYVDDVKDLRKREAHYIKEYQSMYYQNGYNIFDVDDNGYFCHSDETKKKISEANRGKIPYIDIFGAHGVTTKDDTRWESGEIYHNTTNKVSCIDSNGNTKVVTMEEFESSKDLFGVNKGKSTYKDKYGNTTMTTIDDPRVLSGELVGITKGIPSLHAKVITVDGITYRSLEDAYTTLGISKPTFRKLLKDVNNIISTVPFQVSLSKYLDEKNKRQVIIDGIVYKNMTVAVKELGISRYKLKKHES